MKGLTVCSTKFWRFWLSQGGLEIPINLYVGKRKGDEKIYMKMSEFVSENYMEPKSKKMKKTIFSEVIDVIF